MPSTHPTVPAGSIPPWSFGEEGSTGRMGRICFDVFYRYIFSIGIKLATMVRAWQEAEGFSPKALNFQDQVSKHSVKPRTSR